MIYLLLVIAIVSLITSLIAIQKCKNNQTILSRPFRFCELYGSFVWADHIVFGPFWFFVSLVTLLLHDGLLFLLIFSVFWLVRSAGETMYWFFQQFSPRAGNEPHKFWINSHVPGQAVWFVHQIFWQCITVITIVSTIYLASLWLARLV